MPPRRILNKPHYVYRPTQVIRRLAFRPADWSSSQTTVARLPWGAPLECWPADGLGSAILRTGIYDLLTTEALIRLTAPGDVAVDVGANVGHMSSALAHAAGPGGHVIAFEPHPDVHAVLRRNVERWRTRGDSAPVELHACAASDTTGMVTLSSGADFAANRGTSQVVAAGEEVALGGSSRSVVAARLDETVLGTVGVLKLDCEGHEATALAGASRLLEQGVIRDIVFEEFAAYPTPVTDLLEAVGFEIVALVERLNGPSVLEPAIVRADGWDPPVMVASLDARRARERLRGRGWHALRR